MNNTASVGLPPRGAPVEPTQESGIAPERIQSIGSVHCEVMGDIYGAVRHARRHHLALVPRPAEPQLVLDLYALDISSLEAQPAAERPARWPWALTMVLAAGLMLLAGYALRVQVERGMTLPLTQRVVHAGIELAYPATWHARTSESGALLEVRSTERPYWQPVPFIYPDIHEVIVRLDRLPRTSQADAETIRGYLQPGGSDLRTLGMGNLGPLRGERFALERGVAVGEAFVRVGSTDELLVFWSIAASEADYDFHRATLAEMAAGARIADTEADAWLP